MYSHEVFREASQSALLYVRFVYDSSVDNIPKTFSLVPAKSMVLRPLVCCWVEVVGAFTLLTMAGRDTDVETKVRLGSAGTAIFCLDAVRRVRAKVLEAMSLEVYYPTERWYRKSTASRMSQGANYRSVRNMGKNNFWSC